MALKAKGLAIELVTVFTPDFYPWNCKPLQVGSYFGGTLCSVDLDRDTETDLVLIGAPMYYDGSRGGRVYVCQRKVCDGDCWVALSPRQPKTKDRGSFIEQ